MEGEKTPSVALPEGCILTSPWTGTEYIISKPLGIGGFGITYKAIRRDNGRTVAVKELFPNRVASRNDDNSVRIMSDHTLFSKMSSSFVKEARVLASLSEVESVVRIYDYFQTNNTAYYVMEYIDGMTMQAYIAKYGKVSAALFNPIFKGLSEDISTLHGMGIIHRDISPDNIMITRTGRMKLIDFGSARNFEGSRNLTVNIKRNFAPIEQYSEKGQGPYTDVYSLAATLYYCFSGKVVPPAIDRAEGALYVPLMNLNQEITPKQNSAINKALSVLPADRYQTVSEFSADFFDEGERSCSGLAQEITPGKNDELSEKQITDNPAFKNGFAKSADIAKRNPVPFLISGALILIAGAIQFLI